MADVYPPTFGSDGTALIQAGIDTGDPVVYIHAGTYIISSDVTFDDTAFENSTPGAIEGVSNQRVVFLSNAKLIAAVDSFHGKYQSMIRYTEKSDFSIHFEPGSEVRMRKQDYTVANGYTVAEWRHCLYIEAATNYSITGSYEPHLINSGGDGMIVDALNRATPGLRTPCTNGIVTGIIFDDNRRQGCSVISVNGLVFNHCWFRNSLGTSPQSGCDLEPSHPVDINIGVVFNDCVFENNPSRNLFFNYDLASPSTSSPISVEFNNCRFLNGSTNRGIDFKCALGAGPPSGTITFNDCIISNTPEAAIFTNWDLACNVLITFHNLTIIDCAKISSTPLDFTFTGLPVGQGFQFTGICTICETKNRKVSTVSSTNVATNVTGRIRIDRLNRPITTDQHDANLPNVVFEPYVKDVGFLEKIYTKKRFLKYGRN